MNVTTSDPMVGRLLDGRYLIGSRIARGGMATVYEARDTRLNRIVAVKVMHPNFVEDPAFVRRFDREARSAARLSHPGVVAVFDQGEDNGTVFLAMEYVAGSTLRQVLRDEGSLEPSRAIDLFGQILAVLASAHEAGIVHLDIKPENVLLSENGAVKVADFGLARAVTSAPSTATQGLLIGTVSYLSPEQLSHGQADARSDLYAAGIVLYEMLTGERPHNGDSPIQVAYQHVHEDVPPPSGKVAGIPPYIDGLVLRSTARDPNDRPADTRLFLQQARRAQTSLAQGLDDDPELTEDLTLFRNGLGYSEADESAGTEHTVVAPQLDDGAAAPAHADRTRPRHSLTSRRRGIIAIAVVLMLAVGAGVGAWYYGIGRFTNVPALTGRAPAAAEKELRAADLGLEVAGKVYHEDIDRGAIVRSDPDAASRAMRDSTVQVWVSRGPERYDVPELTELTVSQARDLVQANHLRLGTIEEKYHPTVAAGEIISQAPKTGTPLPPDKPIHVVVSRGPKPIKVPEVVGKKADEAEQAIRDANLTPAASQATHPDVPAGQVMSQDPANGTLFRGDTVSYVVSTGPELVQVPNVVRQPLKNAKATLEQAGFKVKVEKSNVHVGLNVVIRQTPPGGQTVPKGSTVTLQTV